MLEYIVTHIVAAGLVVAADTASSPAARFYLGEVARWMLPRFPDAPEGWE